MLNVLISQKWMMVISISLLVFSIGVQIMIGVLYQNLIKETDNMSATSNKLLKKCKLKFAHCYKMNQGVANISVFVDKFLNRLSIGKITFRTFYHLSGQFMLLAIFFAGLGACIHIANGAPLGDVLPYYIVSFLGLYLYFSVSSIVDIKGKIAILKVNLVDYLENHMTNRLNMPEQEEIKEKVSMESLLTAKDESKVSLEAASGKSDKISLSESAKNLFSQMEEEELDDLLRELLA